jgi:hypothetical protein
MCVYEWSSNVQLQVSDKSGIGLTLLTMFPGVAHGADAAVPLPYHLAYAPMFTGGGRAVVYIGGVTGNNTPWAQIREVPIALY